LLFALLAVAFVARAEDAPPGRAGGPRMPAQESRCNDVPAHPFDIVLGRPEAGSVTASVLCYADDRGFIAYGTEPGKLTSKTPAQTFKNGEPAEIVLSALKPDTRYYYELHLGQTVSPEFSFQTARPPGKAFTFTVTADSHLDSNTDPATYQNTLANALADKPDFHVDLGDTFMSEKHGNREAAAKQYLAQRYYFGRLCGSAPLFFVLGNHDGESLRGRGDEGLAVWSALTRKRYFPNPVPDKFYSGDGFQQAEAGLLQDYYAWEWGDALFVVLDPFWFTQKGRGRGDNWRRSLGIDQYLWLKRTLEASRAKFKFVFIHHLVGGADDQCRGGAEAAPFYEWGGKNADGFDGFAQNRPGWPAPIHELLKKNHVSIVFHGHDHLYAKQDLDGIVYQEVPQPGCPGDGRPPRSAADYGYASGTILGSSGHMRVAVSPQATKVDYVRSILPKDETGQHKNGAVADRYEMAAPGK
ncbi:MAG: metallophosphoesterase, partial [Verrucomicrobiota bacterium]